MNPSRPNLLNYSCADKLFQSECLNFPRPRNETPKSSNRKILEILRYLEVSPGPLIREVSGEAGDMVFLKPFMFCVLSRDQSIRHLATEVANRLFARNTGSLGGLQPEIREGSEQLGETLWRRR